MRIRSSLSLAALIVAIALAACAPAAVPAAEPVFYQASAEDVYAAVVQAISTSPGLGGSDGWVITESDAAGGFVRAETTVRGFLGATRTESVSVVVSQATGGRTQVVIQRSGGAGSLAERIGTELDLKFNRA